MRLSRLWSCLFALPLLSACASPALQSHPSAPSLSPEPAHASIPSPKPVDPPQELPLAVERGFWLLNGTLSLPARRPGERVPAVVIVHGSGPMSRDGNMKGQIGLGFGFELPVYKRLAKALADKGYAVYRYDKRTCGSFNGCADTGRLSVPYEMWDVEFSTGEYVRDASQAFDVVSSHPAVDPERVFFVGHSEGGELIPALLAEQPKAKAGVMLAPPFHTMAVVLEQQSERVRWSFSMAGKPDQAESEGNELLEAARALHHVEQGTHLGAPILGQPPGVWASWIDYAKRAPELARQLNRPLLVLGGSYDYNVAPSEIESWARYLENAKQAAHRVRVLPCVTHALNCIRQPDPTQIRPDDIGRDLSPAVVQEVLSFLDNHASKSNARKAN